MVIELARENPRKVLKIKAQLEEETGKRVSDTTIKRILFAAKFIWKRIKKSTKDKRDDDEFQTASDAIADLKQQHKKGEIEVWFFFDPGFDLQPTVPYAWQPKGETIEVSSQIRSAFECVRFFNS